jgi:hypothetical protein
MQIQDHFERILFAVADLGNNPSIDWERVHLHLLNVHLV